MPAGAWAATQYLALGAKEMRTMNIFADEYCNQNTILTTIGPVRLYSVLEILEYIRWGDYTRAIKQYYPHLDTNEISDKVAHIKIPVKREFYDWNSFREHIDSVAIIAKQLAAAGF